MAEEVDCRDIWNSIEKDTEELLNMNLIEALRSDLTKSINDKVDFIHKDIDRLGEEFIERVLNVFQKSTETDDKDKEKEEEKKKKKVKSKEEKLAEKRLEEINLITDEVEKKYRLSMEELLQSVEGMIRKVGVIDISIDDFTNKKLSEILMFKKNEVSFKLDRRIASLLKGKNGFELGWDSTNNKSYSTVSSDDSSHLKIHGTTCYTYYKTDKKFTDEDITIEVEYKISTYDNYFYLGIINQSVVPSSNCMCCTISNGFYIQPNGDTVMNAVRKNYPELNAAKDQVHNVIFRIALSSKEMFIQMDDKNEVGPFTISGNEFTFTSGSCNSVNGYVKIVNASYGA